MNRTLRLLMVEDSEMDVELLQRALSRGGYEVHYEVVDSPEAMRDCLLNRSWDLITSDHSMPRFNAPDALALAKELCPDVPFLIVSGEIDLNLAVSLMRGGAKDYIQKHELVRLLPAIDRELKEAESRRERQQVEKALQESLLRIQEVSEISQDASYRRGVKLSQFDYLSSAFTRITGYTPEEVAALSVDSIRGLVHPADLAEVNRVFAEALADPSGRAFQVDYRVQHKQDGYVWLQDKFSVVRDPDGTPRSFVGSLRDITERKQMEEALRSSAAQTQRILETFQDAYFQGDLSGRIILAGKAAANMYGYASIDEMLGMPVADLYANPIDRELVLSELRRSGIIKDLTIESKRKDGTTFWISLNVQYIRDETGQIMGTEGVVRDITQRKQTEDTLRRSQRDFAMLFENAPDMIARFDTRFRYVYCNRAVEKQLGMPVDRFLGKTPAEISPSSEDGELMTQSIQKVLDTDAELEVERHIPTPAGLKTFATRIVPEHDEEGRIESFLAITRDLSTRRLMEEALRQSEARYRSMMANIADVIAIVSPEGTVQYVSPNHQIWFGWEERDLLGTSAWDRVHPDDLPRAHQVLLGISNQDDLEIKLEFRYQCKDQSYRWINMTVVNLLHDPNVRGLLVNYHDISERKQLEEARRRSEEKFTTAFRISPDAMNINRLRDGLFMDVNEGFTHLSGYTSQDVIGKTSFDVSLWPDLDKRAELVEKLLEHGIITNQEVTFRCKDGQFKVCLLSSKLIEIDGEDCILSVTRDISERKKLEEEVHALNAQLEQRVTERTAQLKISNQELEAFSYSVSHDLRAPVRSIEGYAAALQEEFGEQLDENARHYLQRIHDNTRRMAQLINDLLALSRIPTNQEFPRRTVDLSGLSAQIAAELQAQSPQRRVAVEITPGLQAQGDERLLRIAMENLLSNAFKFTSQVQQARVTVGLLQQDGQAVFYVRDNGAGFQKEYAAKMFIPFRRFHTEQEYPGSGIGLAIVQRIIHRHGGKIWADGDVGQGATFYFVIP